MKTVVTRFTVALAAVALTVGLAPTAMAATGPSDPCWTPAPWTAIGAPPPCPAPADPAPAQPDPGPQPTSSPAPAPASPEVSENNPAPAPSGAKPSTAAEEWAGGTAESIPKVVEDVRDRYKEPPLLSTDSYAIYAVFFGIGAVIYFVMLAIAFTRAGRGGPRARAELWDSMPKLALYFPILAIAPGLAAWFYNQVSQPVGEVAAAQSADSFGKFLDAAGATFALNPFDIFALLGGAVAALFVGLATLGVLFAWLIADITAQFATYLLVAVLPIAGALALYPRWWKMAGRALGLIVGVMLIPTVLRLGFWVMWEFMGGQIGKVSGLIGPLTMLVVFGISTSAPILLSHLMPMVLPQGGTAYGNTGGSARQHGAQALQRGGNAVKALASRGGSGGGGAAGAAATGGKAAAGTSAAGGAAVGGAAVAGGVVLGALVAAVAAGNAVASAGKSAAGQGLAASGGGMTSDQEGGTIPLPAGRGNPGRRASAPAAPQPTSAPSGGQTAPSGPPQPSIAPAPATTAPAARAPEARPMPAGPSRPFVDAHPGPEYDGTELPEPVTDMPAPADTWQPAHAPQWDGASDHPEARFMPPLDPPAQFPEPPQSRKRTP